jgi:Tfp pilus assembly protein PilF
MIGGRMFGSPVEASARTRGGGSRLAWATAFCALTCPLLFGVGSGPNIIRGKVRGPGGGPVDRIEVRLQNSAGYVIDSTYTEATGEFIFRGVLDGTFHVIVDDDRYNRADVGARVDSKVVPMEFVFVALESREGKASSPPAYADGSRTVSVKELNANFPKEAVKQYEKGNSRMQHADNEGAIKHFEKAVALAPGMYPALNNLGTAYMQAHQMDKAEAAFEKALASNPSSADGYVNLGHLYFEKHQYSEAEKSLLRGLERNPGASLAYFFLGLTYEHMGKLPEAEENLRKALSQNDPAVANAHLVLADLFMKTARNGKAQEQLESFLSDWPNDPQADHVRQILARLKGKPTQ